MTLGATTNGHSSVLVTEGQSSAGKWQVASRRPHPRLRHHVIGYVGLKSALHVTRERHLPSGEAALVINLGAPHRIVDLSERSSDLKFCDVAVMGVHERPFLTESDGSKHLAVVRLTPPGARLLFGTPMEHLLNRWVSLDQIDKPLARLISGRGRVGGESWDALFSFLDAALAERLCLAPTSPASVAGWAWSRLRATSGQASIRSLLGELDLSHKRLLKEFRENVGLLPKGASELVRFNRVLRAGRNPSHGMNWVTVAQDCGYHDQAHMIREFKSFAYGTPSEILAITAGFTLREPS